MKTYLDELIVNGSHISTAEQARLDQVQTDTAQAKSRMLILNKKSSQLNTAQKAELQRHTALGGCHSIKPYCDNNVEDFSYKSL